MKINNMDGTTAMTSQALLSPPAGELAGVSLKGNRKSMIFQVTSLFAQPHVFKTALYGAKVLSQHASRQHGLRQISARHTIAVNSHPYHAPTIDWCVHRSWCVLVSGFLPSSASLPTACHTDGIHGTVS